MALGGVFMAVGKVGGQFLTLTMEERATCGMILVIEAWGL